MPSSLDGFLESTVNWSDYKTAVSCLLENDANGVKLVSKNDVSKTQITEMTSKLKEQGVSVLEVKVCARRFGDHRVQR